MSDIPPATRSRVSCCIVGCVMQLAAVTGLILAAALLLTHG